MGETKDEDIYKLKVLPTGEEVELNVDNFAQLLGVYDVLNPPADNYEGDLFYAEYSSDVDGYLTGYDKAGKKHYLKESDLKLLIEYKEQHA